MTATAWRIKLPRHDYAARHPLLRAAHYYGSKKRLRVVQDLEPSGRVACERVREYAFDLGAEYEHSYGWMAKVAKKMKLNYHTLYCIINERVDSISTRTVDHIARCSGIPVRVFYDPEI